MKMFIIAGEASGDYLGGKLMSGIKSIQNDVEFCGIGGTNMENAGLKSLYPLEQLSVIGIWEAIKQSFTIKKKIDDTVQKILEYKPNVLVSIDFPGFTSLVNKAVKAAAPEIPIVHYVAPSVWAWRSGRAKDLPKYVDKLLALFPFEPELFTKYRLETVFVGHPIATDPDFAAPSDSAKNTFWNSVVPEVHHETTHDAWKASVRKWSDDQITVRMCGMIEEERALAQRFSREEKQAEMAERFRYKVITLLPGSRKSEIDSHMAILKEFAEMIYNRYADHETVRFIIPTVSFLEEHVKKYTNDWEISPVIVRSKWDKISAMYISDLAVAASGTVTLELARAGVPTVVMYKTSAITAAIVKSAIKVKYVSLVNLLLDEGVIPELLQGDCKPENICNAAVELLENHDKRAEQRKKFAEVIKMLTPQNPEIAAKEVIKSAK